MARFDSPQDPLFRRLNSSLGFDRRLWPQDIRGSIAHARALERAGVLTADELAELVAGLERVADELESGEFPFDDADEDIHMAIERRLTELAGPVGGKLHTGRSRNDQVATDVALFVIERAERAADLVATLQTTLVDLAERHADWAMPGYTHLQRAQPVYLGHHLLAYFWMLERDRARFHAAAESTRQELPLGSGALAGLNWELDRAAVAAELGFDGVAPNSLYAVSTRDAALEYLSAARDLRDTPLAARVRDRAVVVPGVRFLRAGGRLQLGLRRSCPRRRTRTRPSCCAARPPGSRPRCRPCSAFCTLFRWHTRRTCRRTRRPCSTPSTRSSCASRPAERMLAGLTL